MAAERSSAAPLDEEESRPQSEEDPLLQQENITKPVAALEQHHDRTTEDGPGHVIPFLPYHVRILGGLMNGVNWILAFLYTLLFEVGTICVPSYETNYSQQRHLPASSPSPQQWRTMTRYALLAAATYFGFLVFTVCGMVVPVLTGRERADKVALISTLAIPGLFAYWLVRLIQVYAIRDYDKTWRFTKLAYLLLASVCFFVLPLAYL